MKTFFLVRHEDVHGHSGTGIVAEGVIFDHGMVSMTWLTEIRTVTTFDCIQHVKKLHGHEGKTEVIVEGNRRTEAKFRDCVCQLRMRRRRGKV